MNFEDMRSAWQQDAGNDVKLPDNLETIKRARSPIEKVKKTIRMDMWMFLIFFTIYFALPFIVHRLTPQTQVFYYTLLLMTLIPMSYYLRTFYKFYGRLNKMELNTKDHIDEAYFDLRYAIEIYKVMHHFITPNLFLLGFVIGIGPKINKLFAKLQTIKDFEKQGLISGGVLFAIAVVVMLGFFYFLRFAINYQYGRHLKELGTIRESLKEERN
jgi:hypothetical protein